MTIDPKSLVVGLLVGIAITFSIAASGPKKGAVGRYQLGMADNGSNYTVIDTQTGQVWFKRDGAKLK